MAKSIARFLTQIVSYPTNQLVQAFWGWLHLVKCAPTDLALLMSAEKSQEAWQEGINRLKAQTSITPAVKVNVSQRYLNRLSLLIVSNTS